MKKIQIAISRILVMALLITNVLVYLPSLSFAAGNSNEKADKKTVTTVHHEKTEILVKYKNSVNQDKVKTNLKNKTKLKKLNLKKKYVKNKIDLLEIDAKDSISQVVEELKKDPNVLYAQPNYKLDIMSAPSDPMFEHQWGLQNKGQETEGQPGRSGVDINALNAWNLTQGSSTVVVGLLDTGVDITHNDLKDNIFVNTKEIPGNGIDDDNNGYIDDVNGWDFVNSDKTVYDDATLDFHGTHVAGIIAAKANSEGISGTAPKVKVLPLKFINGNWGYTCDAIDAIEYAMKMGVKIINCSFGGTDDNFALKDTMANSGILFVCAAGNRGADVAVSPVYPACFDIPNVLSVASIDSKGVLSPYSSYGSKIHVAAPGVNILSTTPGNTFDYFTGTSAAVPFVTGIAALLQSYVPNLTITQISQRIKENVVACTNLNGKISAGGRVDAYAALTNTKPEPDTYDGPGNDNSTVPAGQQGGNVDTWYTMDQLAKIKEKLHYGESGVNPASGNFSATVNDMSVPAPGFQVNISRTYNSRSDVSKEFGRGWTFGFTGRVEGTEVVDVSLPNGSVERFRLSGNVYEPEESRSKFVKNADGTYTLTTQDQYKYTFNTNRYLVKMEDRNGNAINITVDGNGKITQITDTVGRAFTVSYGVNGLVQKITDPENRAVAYEYDSENRLSVVTDPMGGKMRYFYDTWGYLNQIQDHNQKIVEKITYNHAEGENQHKVSEATDSLGDTVKYAYDMTNKKTTITDINGRVSSYWFDSSFFTTRIQEPDGKSSYTEYFQSGGKNKYGDVKSKTDCNGNKTQYEIDDRGNVTKIINPDGSTQQKEYDEKNNVTKEVDESGKTTYNVYDDNKINLIKKVQPLNGLDVYDGTNNTGFAITSYQYYIGEESGSSAKGLLKSETDAEGNTTTYTYNAYGDVKTVSDPETGKVTAYEYNRIGWKTAQITPKGNRTEFEYNKNGQLIKTTMVSSKNETQRTVFDILGRKIQEIAPNQYDSAKDNVGTDTYTDNTAGTKYEYFDSGKIKEATNALGDKTSFTYDVYGNLLTETKPNGAMYRYEYDVLDRPLKLYLRDNLSVQEVLLTQYSYATLEDGKTQKTETKYQNSKDKAVTVYIYDYADRLVEQQNPDGTRIRTIYNANGTINRQISANGSSTYFKYDGLDRLTEQWTPFEVSNGNTLYTYNKTEYDKAGRKTTVKSGKDKVILWSIPESFAITNYQYYKNGNVRRTMDSEGRKTEYLYDDDGNVIKESVYTDATNKLVTDYTYNYLGKLEKKEQHVKAGDLYGNDFDDTKDTILTTSYTYDKNGNTKTVTAPNKVITTYDYDELDRQLSQSEPGVDEKGTAVTITNSTTYSWDGNPLTKTDAKGGITKYEYNQRGLLIKAIDAQNGTTAYEYDLAGRKIAEVTPKNYDSTKSIYDVTRIEYVYDTMNRLLAKKDIYIDAVTKQWVTIYTKTCKYDNSGNLIKQLDAAGYDSGAGTTPEEKINTGYGIEYTYNLVNLPITSKDPVAKEYALAFTSRYEYDGLARKISETNANKVETLYTYNNAGDILSVSLKKNASSAPKIVKHSTYDLAGRILEQTDGNGNTTTFEYNALGKVRKTAAPGDSTIPSITATSQYDEMGQLKQQSNSMGRVDLYTYDNQGRQLSHTEKKSDNTQAITTHSNYDLNGNKYSETDGNGNVKTYKYDSLNRLVAAETTVGGRKKTTTCTYDANGNKTSETDWLGNTSTNVYDALNRLIEKRDAYTTIQKLEYNKNSKQIKSTDALGNETRYIYDKNNRLIATIDPEGHTTSQSYDDVGNIIAKTDGRNITTTYRFDEFNRLAEVINPKSEKTTYTYDFNGNKLTQTDGNGNTTSYEYNAANKVIRKIDQGGRIGTPGKYTYLEAKTEKYTYLADGSMGTKTDRNGKQTLYAYDIHGRLTRKAIGETAITYTYDNNDNQLTMTDKTGTTARTYDEENRVITKKAPGFGTTTYTYDNSEGGGLYSETAEDFKHNLTKKVYDKAGRLYEVISGKKTTTYEYYGNGSRKTVTYSDGAKEEYTYYKDGLNKTLTNKKADGTVIDTYSYTYDEAHNQTSKTDRKGTTNYSYDSLNRLEKVTEPNGRTTGYTFDKAGNRLTETILAGAVSVTTTYTYNEQNRLVSTVKRSGAETTTDTYRFDNNGNIVSKTAETVKPVATSVSGGFSLEKSGQSTTSNVTNYKFDVWNQLVKTTAGKKTATYSYNAEGYRVSKTENERTTNYLYEADKVVLETDVEGNETARNIYGLNLLTRTAQNDTMNYMYNGHGDVTALVGENGAIQATYYYDAFGNITEQTGDVNNNITYAGYQYDKETDLYYLNARYYDSKTARFLSEDTYTGNTNDPLSLNLYTYCHNEPMMYVDPSGHWQESDKNLIQSARIAISQLTDIYVTTSDPEVKRACATQAAAIRNCSANIAKTPQYSEVGMLYGQQLKKDGYVSASDWLKISNTYKKESTQNAIVGLKMAESQYVPSAYKNQAIKFTMNTVTAGVKKSTTQTKPQANSSPRVTNNVNGAGKTEVIPQKVESKNAFQQIWETVVQKIDDLNTIIEWNMNTNTIGLFHQYDENGTPYLYDYQAELNSAGADVLTGEYIGVFIGVWINGLRAFKNALTGEIVSADTVLGSGAGGSAGRTVKGTGNKLTTNEAQLKHMFRDAEGHFLQDNPANRAVIEKAAGSNKNLLGVDKYGNSWYAETLPNGTQAWAEMRNGVITEGGLNQVPKVFDPKTGLKANIAP